MALAGTMFEVLPACPSSAITALTCRHKDATEIVDELRCQYGLLVAPNGGDLKSSVIRVAHMGAQISADIELLVAALRDIDLKSRQSNRV
jgi:aspartate aminotransferase-like enzyme